MCTRDCIMSRVDVCCSRLTTWCKNYMTGIGSMEAYYPRHRSIRLMNVCIEKTSRRFTRRDDKKTVFYMKLGRAFFLTRIRNNFFTLKLKLSSLTSIFSNTFKTLFTNDGPLYSQRVSTFNLIKERA